MAQQYIQKISDTAKKTSQTVKLCVTQTKKFLIPEKQSLMMYALYKDCYFYAKNLGDQVMIWRNAKICDWDYMMLPNGSKIYRKRVDAEDIEKLFFAAFLVCWNDVLCNAKLTPKKDEVILQLKQGQKEIAIENKFKWSKKNNCWQKKVPIDSCDKYIFKIYNLYHGKKRIKNKYLSQKYWIEMYEKLVFEIEEPIT